jgi:hypothetical protein
MSYNIWEKITPEFRQELLTYYRERKDNPDYQDEVDIVRGMISQEKLSTRQINMLKGILSDDRIKMTEDIKEVCKLLYNDEFVIEWTISFITSILTQKSITQQQFTKLGQLWSTYKLNHNLK